MNIIIRISIILGGESSQKILDSDTYGFSFLPIRKAYTSWIAPLALSWVRYLRHSEFADYDLNDDTIQQIKERIASEGGPWQDDGICKMQDLKCQN